MATSWTRYVWQQPVGMPHSGSIQIGLTGSGLSGSRAVTVYPFCPNASHFQLFEAGGYDATSWTAMARSDTYTFASDGTKTLYAAFRNPSFFVIGDDSTIYDTVTVDTDLASGLASHVHSDIVAILRANATLQAYVDGWESTTEGHVIPIWADEDIKALGEHNLGRLPFVEVKTGKTGVSRDGNGCLDFTIPVSVRAWLEVPCDGDSSLRESLMNGFLWDIMEALNAYPTLTSCYIESSCASSMDPRIADGRTYSVGLYEHVVRASMPLQTLTT